MTNIYTHVIEKDKKKIASWQERRKIKILRKEELVDFDLEFWARIQPQRKVGNNRFSNHHFLRIKQQKKQSKKLLIIQKNMKQK